MLRPIWRGSSFGTTTLRCVARFIFTGCKLKWAFLQMVKSRLGGIKFLSSEKANVKVRQTFSITL